MQHAGLICLLTRETNHSGGHSRGAAAAAAAAVVLKARMFVQYMLIHQVLHA